VRGTFNVVMVMSRVHVSERRVDYETLARAITDQPKHVGLLPRLKARYVSDMRYITLRDNANIRVTLVLMRGVDIQQRLSHWCYTQVVQVGDGIRDTPGGMSGSERLLSYPVSNII